MQTPSEAAERAINGFVHLLKVMRRCFDYPGAGLYRTALQQHCLAKKALTALAHPELCPSVSPLIESVNQIIES